MSRRALVVIGAAVAFGASELAGQSSTGTLSGIIRNQGGQPVAGAEISIQAIARRAISNDSGRFILKDIPAGPHEVVVRRLGYQELTLVATIPRADSVARTVELSPVTELEPVLVRAEGVIPTFEEHRAIGLGKFLTRADLEPQENRKLAEILEQVGATSLRNGAKAWVGSGRSRQLSMINRATNLNRCAQLEGAEPRRGDPRNPGCGCFALVFMNEMLLFDGESGRVVPDVNLISPQSLEAIEFYKGPSQTPMRYSRLNSECGVLVLHTRRTFNKADKSKPD